MAILLIVVIVVGYALGTRSLKHEEPFTYRPEPQAQTHCAGIVQAHGRRSDERVEATIKYRAQCGLPGTGRTSIDGMSVSSQSHDPHARKSWYRVKYDGRSRLDQDQS
jgi:hypothetical protein